MNGTVKIPVSMQREPDHVQERYCQLVASGTDPWIAEMHATRSYPSLKTDTSYIPEKTRTLADQFKGDPTGIERLIAAAKKQGFTPPTNCSYDPGLARSFGDPAAFVPNHEGRSHIKAVVTARNQDCIGPVTHMAVRKDPPKGMEPRKGKRLANDLADEAVKRMVRRDPKLALASKTEQRQEAARIHGCD